MREALAPEHIANAEVNTSSVTLVTTKIELIQKRSDMIVVDLTITPERSKVISYVKTLFNTKMVLVIKTPSASINLSTYIAPFHYWVWSAIFILLFILLPILMYLSTRYVHV